MSNLSVTNTVNAVWVALGEGKRLHPRVNKEGVKKEIEAAVEAVINTAPTTKLDVQA